MSILHRFIGIGKPKTEIVDLAKRASSKGLSKEAFDRKRLAARSADRAAKTGGLRNMIGMTGTGAAIGGMTGIASEDHSFVAGVAGGAAIGAGISGLARMRGRNQSFTKNRERFKKRYHVSPTQGANLPLAPPSPRVSSPNFSVTTPSSGNPAQAPRTIHANTFTPTASQSPGGPAQTPTGKASITATTFSPAP